MTKRYEVVNSRTGERFGKQMTLTIETARNALRAELDRASAALNAFPRGWRSPLKLGHHLRVMVASEAS